MTNNSDSDQLNSGTKGTPTPDVSPDSGAQPDSSVTDVLERLTGRLEAIEQQQRALQSGKDRAVNKNATELRKVLEEVEELKSTGLTQEQAVSQLELKNTLEEMKSQLASLSGNAGSVTPQPGPLSQVIEEAGLAADDADLLSIMSTGKATEADIWKLAAKKAKLPSPTPAQTLTKQASPLPNSDLQAQYQKELLDVPRGDPRALFNLKAKYRELGLDIH
jgi:hypothetical protein